MEHTISMYPTKDAMIEAMQAEIDSLKAQLAQARKDSERLDWIIFKGGAIGISDSVDFNENFDEIPNSAHFKAERLYWIDGVDEIARGSTPREAIDNAMKGGE